MHIIFQFEMNFASDAFQCLADFLGAGGRGLAKMSRMNCVIEKKNNFLIFSEKPATITLKGKILIFVNTHGHPKNRSCK